MKLRQAVACGMIVFVAVIIGMLLCEAGARILLNPGDYLSVRTIRDPILGIRIAGGSAGFDEWGFRNRRVPSSANVVTIGDSHTFGNTVTMHDSWPSVVARTSGLEVYNLGVGGYGPNQYRHLLTTRAVRLRPQWVVCGLYMGDDFENAFSITYGLDHWSAFRNGRWEDVHSDIWETSEPAGLTSSTRNWLSENSMVYRLMFHGPLFAGLIDGVRFRGVAGGSDPYTTSLTVGERNIREAFRPIGLANRLDQTSERVREGMRITFRLLREMDEVCVREGCRFVVVIIPTKETVFSEYLEGNPRLHLHEAVDRLISNERVAKRTLIESLGRAKIAYLDVLPALQQAVGNELYARTTRDMHPGRNGYRVIGEAVAGYLVGLVSGRS